MTSARTTRGWARQLGQLLAAVPLFLVAPLARPWHIRWGATDDEVTAPMPGDDPVPGCQYRATRAITIDADRRYVWPWLVQVGVGRAGFYSVDLLDNLARPSATEILPAHQRPSVGAWIPMTATPTTTTAFTVHSFDPEQVLVWAKPDSTWVWRLTTNADGSTRLVTRIRACYHWSRPGSAALSILLMEFGDFAMLRTMLHGIKIRSERLAAQALTSPTTPAPDTRGWLR